MRYVKETTHAEFMVSDHIGRNENEPSEASLRNFAVINLPELVKSDIYREVTVISTDIAARSKMGWHVWYGLRMNTGGPNIFRDRGMMRESEMPIVVMIIGTT